MAVRMSILRANVAVKAVILAGGLGTRLSEETAVRPKPMVEIGGKPILWHIMKIYSAHGINDFVICLGYKGYMIKEYFANYFLHTSDVTFDLQAATCRCTAPRAEPWRVTLVDTGEKTMTGGRLRRVLPTTSRTRILLHLRRRRGRRRHRRADRFPPASRAVRCTVTAVQPPGRFGALEHRRRARVEQLRGEAARRRRLDERRLLRLLAARWLDYIEGRRDRLGAGAAAAPCRATASSRAYHHHGFWQPMDTLRDRNDLEDLWRAGALAPWQTS